MRHLLPASAALMALAFLATAGCTPSGDSAGSGAPAENGAPDDAGASDGAAGDAAAAGDGSTPDRDAADEPGEEAADGTTGAASPASGNGPSEAADTTPTSPGTGEAGSADSGAGDAGTSAAAGTAAEEAARAASGTAAEDEEGAQAAAWRQRIGDLPFVVGHAQGMERMESSGRPGLFFVTTRSSEQAGEVLRSWSSSGELRSLLDRFVCVLVDAEAEPDTAARLGADGWPYVAVRSANDEPLLSFGGTIEPEQARSRLDTALRLAGVR